jgi:hypothetical protein
MFGFILILWKIKFPDRFNLAVTYGALAYLDIRSGQKLFF